MTEECYLVTGGTGCIGSWVVRNLVREDVPVVLLTVDEHTERLRLILSADEFARIKFAMGDVTDLNTLLEIASRERVHQVIHLAGLQLPFCRANPVQGAQVNVVGTVNIFEMARQAGIPHVVYASSAAVFGPKDHYKEDILPEDAPFYPTSHYGAYKVANEQNAAVFWRENGISSIGLRPHSVYGPGRDQGMTSKPTLAVIAAAAGRSYNIPFTGSYQFQYTDDVARVFIRAARSPLEGAAVYNLGGPAQSVEEIVRVIAAAAPGSAERITCSGEPLALPSAFQNLRLVKALGAPPETPIEEGISRTLACYRDALASGLIDDPYLDRVLS